jgi:hypothetical protein
MNECPLLDGATSSLNDRKWVAPAAKLAAAFHVRPSAIARRPKSDRQLSNQQLIRA